MRPALAIERPPCVLIGIPKGEFPRQLTERVKQVSSCASVVCVDTVEGLRGTAKERQPRIIIADERVLSQAALAESIAELAAVAPVVLVAAYHKHAEIERMVVAGQAEFVPRVDDWESLAASLVERRLLSMEGRSRAVGSWGSGSGDDMGEIFRHEINNPLTGILGNAELLLAHSDKFPPAETQRIRTVVELAVRLRETVRRVSDRWSKSATFESKCDLSDG
ncbi:MAG TPA: histidine kinase dimerization/phospho-acceptor domain-containing protein [Candidatus Acidoferrum sp.]|nr:histidine kinase dimerization/phospho-acceptor domain-containing protein [Candidatus Acidoferrum sp.]